MRTTVALVALFSFALCAPRPARAQAADEEKIAEAKRAFKAGQELMQMDRYPEAIVEFNKAYEITKDGLVMGQIALAYEKAGDYQAALDSLKVYREALPEADRGSVDEMIKRYQEEIEAGRSKKLVLPGSEPEPSEDEALLGFGEVKKDEPAPSGKRKRLWTWIAAGTTGALAVTALVVGLSAQSKYDDLETQCGNTGCDDGEIDSVETRALTADVLWGVAAAGAVTTVLLYFLEGRKSSPTKEPALDDESWEDEEIVKRLRLTPVVGKGQLGLGAELRY